MVTTRQQAELTVGQGHQLDALARVLAQLGWDAGTRVGFNVIAQNTIVLMRFPPKTAVRPEGWAAHFAGKLGDVFGDHDEIMAYLAEERRSWEPEERGDVR